MASTEASSAAGSTADDGECRYCAGARYVRLRVPQDDPRFGQAVPCRCASDESERVRTERLQRYSNIGPLARLTFRDLLSLGRSANHRDQQR